MTDAKLATDSIPLIPTSAIGSIPRSNEVQMAMNAFLSGQMAQEELDEVLDKAVKETIEELEKAGSTIVGDGEQTKSSFVTYPFDGIQNLHQDEKAITIEFADGHIRELPLLKSGPFRYGRYAGSFVPRAKRYASRPIKQSVIAASAISLIYPKDKVVPDYPREQFLQDLIQEAVKDIRSCLDAGAQEVQIDFTEGRLAVKLDPSKGVLRELVELNNQILSHFSEEEHQRIGIHTCPGGDHDSTHSADVPYEEFIPDLLQMNSRNFYMQMASEKDPVKSLKLIAEHLKPSQRVHIGVINVIDENVETAEQIRDRVLLAARYIPVGQLGTTDDCGFAPFCDDVATSRSTAFAKIRARCAGTDLANEILQQNGGKIPENL